MKLNIGEYVTEYTKEYIDILGKTIIRDYISNNENIRSNIMEAGVSDILSGENSKTLPKAILDYLVPKGSSNTVFDLVSDLIRTDYRLSVQLKEQLVLSKMDIPDNKVFDKGDAYEFLTKIKEIYEYELEEEIKNYVPDLLVFIFYSIANQLAFLSVLNHYKLNTTSNNDFSFYGENTTSMLLSLISTMDVQGIIQTSAHIGREKQIIDIIFNLTYKLYNVQKPEEKAEYKMEIDIQKIYELAHMVMKANILLKSNGLLYEGGEVLKIQKGVLVQSGDFAQKMNATLLDIVNFNYNQDIVNEVLRQYSKREGFCPNDLNKFVEWSIKENGLRTCLSTRTRNELRDLVLMETNVKEYGVDRFLDVLTLKKDKNEITHHSNKLSILPFVELEYGIFLYADNLLLQATQMLGPRMLQNSFTANKKLKDFIKKNYDEIGIKDLVNELERADFPHLAHVDIGKVNNPDVRKLLSAKGITKEFDLVFTKDNILYVVEYKTWKISSFNIMQILNEQKKITGFIEKHKKAIKIIENHPKEFKELFGEKINEYNKIELVMVFQNPTAFKYLNNSKEVKVTSPKEFEIFIDSL
ncbi:hypothetical protein [Bacillus mycoides]|uniref:NERD domain-containing protein n=1 Tax=Bacillus mycoides TaxID=1405 RepID=A0A4V5TSJ6_BACMY|nr:hypothetical protein [Bacillus mycoides]TKI86363.1 hypothetical protein FC701_06240 [Bacillus mycoides]